MKQAMFPRIDTPVILVDDDESFAEEFAQYLEAHGFQVTRLTSLHGLDEHIRSLRPALLVLDQFLGKSDSLTMLPRIRHGFSGGVVVMTGNQEPMDRVIGLELGADDFIPKTQPPRETLARLHAVLRRVYVQPGAAAPAGAMPDGTTPAPPPGAATAAVAPASAAPASVAMPAMSAPRPPGWRVDTHRREVVAPNGAVLDLTAAEFDLLAYLSVCEGEVVSRDSLSEAVLRRKFLATDRAIDNLVARVRLKLRPFVGERTVIKSVRTAGYVFVGFDVGP